MAELMQIACFAFTFGATNSASAGDVAYTFEWIGGGGYSMKGAFAFDPTFVESQLVFQDNLSCFEVTGFFGDEKIGRWALGFLENHTTWTLTFDPIANELLTYSPEYPMPQAWNMDGFGENCGNPGFGFNIGNAAQDICVDGELIIASQVSPPRPFPVQPAQVKFGPNACLPELLLGSLVQD